VELIDNTLQIITSMQTQKRDLQQENDTLKQQLAQAVEARESLEYERAHYMQGAVWMGGKLSTEIERMCQRIDDIVREYTHRESEHGIINGSTTSFGGNA
jgi:cell division septum initiation protein DivIVA